MPQMPQTKHRHTLATATATPTQPATLAPATLEARRQALGCSQARLARHVGVSATTISRLLRATDVVTTTTRREERLRQIAETLDKLEDFEAARQDSLALAALPPASSVASALQSYRLLIVEDDPATIELYRLVLAEEEQAQYALTVVRTAQDCLAALKAAGPSHTFDLLILDLNLRDTHALETDGTLLAQLMRIRDTLPRRLLVVSGMSPFHLREIRDDLTTLGAAYLPKPFDLDQLLTSARSLCLPDAQPASCLSFFVAGQDA